VTRRFGLLIVAPLARWRKSKSAGTISKFFGTKSKPSGTNSKSGGAKSKFKILQFPSLNPAFSMAYADPRGFPLSGLGTLRRGWAPVFPSGRSSVVFVFVSGSSGFFKRVKGWRRFHDRGRFDGRGASSRKGNPSPRTKKPEDRGTGRPIDPTSGKNTPASPRAPNSG
jgi:hypothetical protein